MNFVAEVFLDETGARQFIYLPGPMYVTTMAKLAKEANQCWGPGRKWTLQALYVELSETSVRRLIAEGGLAATIDYKPVAPTKA